MSKNGGYQIIEIVHDFKSADSYVYTTEDDTLYDLFERTTKPILISGIAIDGVDQKDFFADFVLDGSSFVAQTSAYSIEVSLDGDQTAVTLTLNE